jgi:hypothetical protein
MGFFPTGFELPHLFLEHLLAVLDLIELFELANSFELEHDLLEVTATLSGSAVLQMFLHSLKNFADPN